MPNHRHQLTDDDFLHALEAVHEKLNYRVQQKGKGCFASSHEILGYTLQECDEFMQAVHHRVPDARKIEELLDIAVCAIWGIASIRSGGVDW